MQAVIGVVGFAMGILTARWLGAEARGSLTLVLLIPYFLSVFMSLGMNDGAPYIVNRLQVALEDLRSTFIIYSTIIGGALAVALGLFVVTLGPGLWGVEFDLSLALMVGAIFLGRLWGALGRGLMLAQSRYAKANIADVIDGVTPLVVFALLSSIMEPSLHSAAVAYAVSALVQSLYIFLAIHGERSRALSRQLIATVFQTGAKYGGKTLIRAAGGILLQRADFFLVGFFLGPVALGLYSVANTMAEVIVRLPDAASWLLGPKVSRQSETDAIKTTNSMLQTVGILTSLAAMAVYVGAPFLISKLIGEAYKPALDVLPFLLVGAVISTAHKMLGSSLTGRGHALSAAVGTWVGAVIMVVLDVVLLPRLGLIGAGIATCVGYSANAAWVTHRYLAISAVNRVLQKGEVVK